MCFEPKLSCPCARAPRRTPPVKQTKKRSTRAKRSFPSSGHLRSAFLHPSVEGPTEFFATAESSSRWKIQPGTGHFERLFCNPQYRKREAGSDGFLRHGPLSRVDAFRPHSRLRSCRRAQATWACGDRFGPLSVPFPPAVADRLLLSTLAAAIE